MAALRVRRIDFRRRRITVAESATEGAEPSSSAQPRLPTQRTVPIPGRLLEPLARRCEGKGAHELVLTSPEGSVLRTGNFRHRFFDPAAKAAGLPDFTPHDLRHTAASLLDDSGANVKAIQRMLGHASAAMTLDLYSGLFDDDLRALVERMDAAHDAHVTERVVGTVWARTRSSELARTPSGA